MSSDPAVRTLRLPSADLGSVRIPKARQPKRLWFRVHPSKYRATHFSLKDIHRFSHPECLFPVLYLGTDIATCLFETFADKIYDRKKAVAYSLWRTRSVSAIAVPEIHVCDLTNAKTLSALMVDLGALMHNELKTPQEWGLAIQRHPANFQGIKFRSRYNHKVCLALFQRDGIEKQIRETALGALAINDAAADWLHNHKVSLY